jgi:hypothetical protein
MATSIDRYVDVVARRGPIGRRMQVNLTDRQHAMLQEESDRTGLPISELVRRAVDAVYRPNARFRVRGMELNVGLWHDLDAAAVGRRRRLRRPRSES